ncbi:P-type conjugative transfer protein TrbJ [Sphingomonas koreensis]|nr:P-type conjugative transfer protein TrbJ [Sphingomonas koreensis]
MFRPRRLLRRFAVRKYLIASSLALGATGALTMAFVVTPAYAQITVFDPGNYSQNLLTAARSLQQINQQIQSLQNQATMLTNQARNLSRINFPEVQALTQTIQQVDRLMNQAQSINYQVDHVGTEFGQLFPTSFNQALTSNAHVIDANARLNASRAAFQQTMTVQAQIVGNVGQDAQTLSQIVDRSQSADGAVQVGQATNQLLALVAKQQFQLQQMMAAQYRAETMAEATRLEAQTDARAATTKFLGSESAYAPN